MSAPATVTADGRTWGRQVCLRTKVGGTKNGVVENCAVDTENVTGDQGREEAKKLCNARK